MSWDLRFLFNTTKNNQNILLVNSCDIEDILVLIELNRNKALKD